MQNYLHLAFAALVGVLMFVAALCSLSWLDARNQTLATHVNQQPRVIPAYPTVLGHTIVDRKGNAKILMLHKLTKPPSAEAVPFHWIDLLALDPPDRHLRCVIDDKPVRISSAVKVFWAVDEGDPASISLSGVDIAPNSSADAKWDLLVEGNDFD